MWNMVIFPCLILEKSLQGMSQEALLILFCFSLRQYCLFNYLSTRKSENVIFRLCQWHPISLILSAQLSFVWDNGSYFKSLWRIERFSFKFGDLWLLIQPPHNMVVQPTPLKTCMTLMNEWRNPQKLISLQDLHILAAHLKCLIHTVFSHTKP